MARSSPVTRRTPGPIFVDQLSIGVDPLEAMPRSKTALPRRKVRLRNWGVKWIQMDVLEFACFIVF